MIFSLAVLHIRLLDSFSFGIFVEFYIVLFAVYHDWPLMMRTEIDCNVSSVFQLLGGRLEDWVGPVYVTMDRI